MINRSLRWMLVALGLGAFGPHRAFGQSDASAPLPAGVTACDFRALAMPGDPDGAPIRESPQHDARVLGRLPALKDKDTDSAGYSRDGELAEFRVLGAKDGWFLIEGAEYPELDRPKLYATRGWLDGKAITTNLFRDTLKKAPSNTSPDVAHLYGTSDGRPYQPYGIDVQRVVGCAGPWLEVEIHQPGVKTLAGKPASADGTVRGWTDRSCPQQRDGPCKAKQFDYTWSPLPAGATECNFYALSNDRDPAGLNVREAPDAAARVLGRLMPPTAILGSDIKVAAEVRVIGFQKGWFLIEAGPYDGADLVPLKAKPYIGRGWVSGNMLTTELLRRMLKQAPDEKSADVVDLYGDGSGQSNPQNVRMRRIIACSGDWVHVEIALEKGMKPVLATDAPKGAVRGWANGTCTAQLTTCDFSEPHPWSPPAPLPPE
jgi:hypothetical protein